MHYLCKHFLCTLSIKCKIKITYIDKYCPSGSHMTSIDQVPPPAGSAGKENLGMRLMLILMALLWTLLKSGYDLVHCTKVGLNQDESCQSYNLSCWQLMLSQCNHVPVTIHMTAACILICNWCSWLELHQTVPTDKMLRFACFSKSVQYVFLAAFSFLFYLFLCFLFPCFLFLFFHYFFYFLLQQASR